MNSKLSEESPSSSQEDNNANLSTGMNENQSKGAIPKTKNYMKNPQNGGRKDIKVNNNFEHVSSLNIAESTGSYLKINGFSKKISSDFSANGDGVEVLEKSMSNYEPSLNTSVSLQDIHLDDDSSSGSSEENELSGSEDGCIYTYKGDSVADLPSSFYNIELPILDNEDINNQRQNNSSPEMDFLEMDFDPGPSGDGDSELSSSSQIEQPSELPLDKEPERHEEPCCSKTLDPLNVNEMKIESNQQEQTTNKNEEKCSKVKTCKTRRKEIEMPWSCTLAQRTKASKQMRTVKKHMNSYGELSSPKESSSPISDQASSISSDHVDEEEEKIMIWSEQEAALKQITQIGPSSCGATAVLNVLIALRLPIPSLEIIQESVQTKLRANFGPLTEYLKSRSKAGCSHKEIITGLYKASNGKVYARFFSMYPERHVNIYKWLGFWIKQGAVPIATLNLQKCDGPIPDSWHHQMIFGVDSNNVYLTNPLECVNSGALWHQLVSEPVLLIRREDVLSRWNVKTDLKDLGNIEDSRWMELNVLGQVAKIVREQPRETRENSTVTSHIKIPADYKSGVTIAIDMNSPAYPLLRYSPELPLLNLSNAEMLS